jgi:uncharacterized protein (TIGR02271 family)
MSSVEENRNAQPGGSYNPTIVIPVIQEQATISTRVVETGTVQVNKTVSEHTEPVHVVASHDECTVERVAVDRVVETAPEVRWDGDTMIVPVVKEVAVVVKKLVLVEELHITRRAVQTQETVQVTLRKEHVDVTRTPKTP